MFRTIFRKFNYLRLNSINNSSNNDAPKKENIPKSIKVVKEKLTQTFSECSDFVIRELDIGEKRDLRVILAYIDGLVRKEIVDTELLKTILIDSRLTNLNQEFNKESTLVILKENLLAISGISDIDDFNESIQSILSGDTILYIDGNKKALKADTRAFESRGVEEPDTESVVRGPREGFTESIRLNSALIRRKVKNVNLKFETMTLGKQTNTDVMICYIKGIAHEDVIETVKRRLKKINTDAILESGYIEEFIEDAPYSIFPTVGNTEKPDVTAGKLLEGRVAILCDGTPFVLTVPYLFVETIQASEDYYSRFIFSSFLRIIRVLALILSTLTPAVYVALISFHHDIIPEKLMLTIAASREGVPFSTFVEALLMILAFEMLREAGVRMPRPVGQAVSIVGALVLGQQAVEAGLVSNLMVIVIALTAITSFIVPPMGGTIPFLRYALLGAANILGFMGLFLVGEVILIYLCSLRSFGVPYMAPFSPLYGMDLKDTFIRVPTWAMFKRPKSLTANKNGDNSYRMKVNIRKKED
ncbi:spore germination protein [Mycoplasmatota bacterium]|nr:spore germination protein [Mycoplasmatota bacterium]